MISPKRTAPPAPPSPRPPSPSGSRQGGGRFKSPSPGVGEGWDGGEAALVPPPPEPSPVKREGSCWFAAWIDAPPTAGGVVRKTSVQHQLSRSRVREDRLDFQIGDHFLHARHRLHNANDLVLQFSGVNEPCHPDNAVVSTHLYVNAAR